MCRTRRKRRPSTTSRQHNALDDATEARKGTDFGCRKQGNKEYLVARRLPLILCVVMGMDALLWGMLWYWFGWKVGLIETGATTVIGLTVILYYEWRWSEAVAKRLELEPATLDSWTLERILLLISGIVFLIPGVVTDLLGAAVIGAGSAKDNRELAPVFLVACVRRRLRPATIRLLFEFSPPPRPVRPLLAVDRSDDECRIRMFRASSNANWEMSIGESAASRVAVSTAPSRLENVRPQ